MTVLGAGAQIAALGATLPGIAGGSFVSQLQSVQSSLGTQQKTATCGALNALANHVKAQSGKNLTAAHAAAALAAAARIGAVISC